VTIITSYCVHRITAVFICELLSEFKQAEGHYHKKSKIHEV